jgi:hypothetical protein
MKELKYIEKIRSGESLLSMPQSLSQILSMISDGEFSMDDLNDVIMKDPVLTSKVLKMANSAFYSQRTQISTVNQAVIMLGVMQANIDCKSGCYYAWRHAGQMPGFVNLRFSNRITREEIWYRL